MYAIRPSAVPAQPTDGALSFRLTPASSTLMPATCATAVTAQRDGTDRFDLCPSDGATVLGGAGSVSGALLERGDPGELSRIGRPICTSRTESSTTA